MEIEIKTSDPVFDNFYPKIKAFLEKDLLDVVIDGKKIRGYRSPDTRSIWIRDYSDILRGVRYFEKDLTSTIQHFAETQSRYGRIFDYFTTFPEKQPCERENWTKYVRVPVEADVEYRFIKAVYLAWQATGDDRFLRELLPSMEMALDYIRVHSYYWDKEAGLIKRPYTIDTWDFAYTAGQHDWLQFQINDETYWGYMHGDNSGYYEAFLIMSTVYDYLGDDVTAMKWREKAVTIRTVMNRVCWNGSFYTHFVKITPVSIKGVDESVQLSLSNPVNINRGVTSHKMAVSILGEYRKRGAEKKAFAEWYSIDPPFPGGIFGDEKLVAGAYINGGIMPLVGGELARAAFEHGFENYAVEILQKYYSMISESGETYLWYFPDGTPSSVETSTSPDAEPSDGWGSSAMLYAFVEGLAGITDQHKQFEKVRVSPRWYAAGIHEAEVNVGYNASGCQVGYTMKLSGNHMILQVRADSTEMEFHVLIPEHCAATRVEVDGKPVFFRNLIIENSNYVDFSNEIKGKKRIVIKLDRKDE
ncbi:MAG: hypothetical protein JSV24_12220 [Bacteroidales bacterium]|nr:MAG: hypothetical protein JSV24_12220 [Bacteroidales bacterium]